MAANDRSDAAGRGGTVAWTRSRLLTSLAIALAMLPLVISAVDLVADVGTDYHAVGDVAAIELHVRDVGRHPVLLGLFSRDGWNHPGPVLFYLLALPYRLVGSASIGLHLGALLINGGAIVGMAVVARRRGGTALMLLTLIGCGLLVHSIGPTFSRDPWVPKVAVLPFGLVAFLAWAMTCREAWALPVAAGVASFCVQTHVNYLPLAFPLVVGGAVWLVRDAYWGRSASGTGRGLQRRNVKRSLVAALGVLVVMWFPPLLEEALHWPGNLSELGVYFLEDADKPHHSFGEGYRLISGQFGWPPQWVTGDLGSTIAPEPEFLRSAPAPVLLLPVALAAFVLFRHGRREQRRFIATVAVLLLLGVLTVVGTLGPVYEYRVGWVWVVAMMAFVVLGWALWTEIHRWSPRLESSLLIPLAMSALLLLAGINSSDAARAPDPSSPALVALVRPVIDSLPDRDGDVILRCDGDDASCYIHAGLFLWLERRGIAARTDGPPGLIASGGEHRSHRRGPVRAVLQVSIGRNLDARLARPDERLVAYWGSPSRRERTDVIREVAALDALHREGRIDDIGYYVRRVRLVKQLDPFAIGVFALSTRSSTTTR